MIGDCGNCGHPPQDHKPNPYDTFVCEAVISKLASDSFTVKLCSCANYWFSTNPPRPVVPQITVVCDCGHLREDHTPEAKPSWGGPGYKDDVCWGRDQDDDVCCECMSWRPV